MSTEHPTPEQEAISRLQSVFDGTHPAAQWSRAHAAELFQRYESQSRRIAELQKAYDRLTGEKFSDRVHAALHSRIAELEQWKAWAEPQVENPPQLPSPPTPSVSTPEESVRKCACGVTLTAEEIEYYEHSCNECEGRTMYEKGAPVRGQLDAVTALRKKIETLQTVMIAAAEEIQKHWDAHCDKDGYGPANLMTRLEAGLASEYGYKAGDFEKMRLEIKALKAQLVSPPPIQTQCTTHATEYRIQAGIPCPWCVIDELKRNRDKPPAAPTTPKDEWFRVEVSDHRGQIVAIEPEMLAGREIDGDSEATIRTAISHLSGFVGREGATYDFEPVVETRDSQ